MGEEKEEDEKESEEVGSEKSFNDQNSQFSAYLFSSSKEVP